MEHPKYHELVRPAREIVNSIGERVCSWVIGDAFNNFMQGMSEESAKRTVEAYSHPQLPFEDGEA